MQDRNLGWWFAVVFMIALAVVGYRYARLSDEYNKLELRSRIVCNVMDRIDQVIVLEAFERYYYYDLPEKIKEKPKYKLPLLKILMEEK